MIFNALKYGYINAKISALKTQLLTQKDYETLISTKGVEGMIDILYNTHYKIHLEKYNTQYRGSKLVDISASSHLSKILKKLIKAIPKEDYHFLRHFLRRYEIKNMKIFISHYQNEKWENIEPYIIETTTPKKYYKMALSKKPMHKALQFLSLGKELLNLRYSLLPPSVQNTVKNFLRENLVLSTSILLDYYSILHLHTVYLLTPSNTPLKKIFRNLLLIKIVPIINKLGKNDLIKDEKLNRYIERDLKELENNNIIDYVTKKRKETFYLLRKIIPITVLKPERIFAFILLLEEEVNNLHRIAVGKEMGIKKEDILKVII